ncbi:MAG: bifunctional serine/threonine-protein kinase/formylglycine-generating enzyme family protein [Bacteroidaceae bacterium]|nr:bifunctional serine/threonine-protein kinase/formylglycine-generating enzyme family protein [Bacteroidaceae bacterium]
MVLPVNSTLHGGQYKIVRFISAGGFGCTYEAYDTLMETRVAIKEFFVKDYCVRDEATSHITLTNQSKRELMGKLRQKFIEEARALFKMKHDNIVHVNTFFEENGTAYYVMEYVDGLSLNDILKKRGSLSETEMLGYIRQVAAALKYVHQQNRLHLDVKPGNILVDNTGKAVLIDFGASKHYDEGTGENTTTMQGLNTPGYAPYEQTVEGITEFTPASDIYALGATMYKLLTGVTPPNSGLLFLKKKTLAPLPKAISSVTRNAIAAAMQLHEEDRPQSIDEFLKLLDGKDIDIVDPDEDKTEYNDKTKSGEEEGDTVKVEVVKPKPVPEPPKPGPAPRPQPPTPKQKSFNWKLYGGIAVAIIAIISAISIYGGAMGASGSGVDTTSVDSTYIKPTLDSLITINANGVDFNMILVKAGTFTMGATSEQGSDASDDEKPAHQVTLTNDYCIGQTEVTQALWKAVMGSNPSNFKGDNLPVENVSWDDCQKFIQKLNGVTEKQFRLPTEAEWEFAARGGSQSKGYKYSGSNTVEEVAWFWDNSSYKTHPVATKSPNELGIYDMSGNVREWCSDWYGDYQASAQTNPTGPNNGSSRVRRGGSWDYYARHCRLSNRYYYTPDYRNYDLGLRLVLLP